MAVVAAASPLAPYDITCILSPQHQPSASFWEVAQAAELADTWQLRVEILPKEQRPSASAHEEQKGWGNFTACVHRYAQNAAGTSICD